jgi:hypothetical protein
MRTKRQLEHEKQQLEREKQQLEREKQVEWQRHANEKQQLEREKQELECEKQQLEREKQVERQRHADEKQQLEREKQEFIINSKTCRTDATFGSQLSGACGSEHPKSERFCPHAHDAKHFLPGFIDAQTNRLQHVFRDSEAYGIPEIFEEQWAPYKSYTMCKYYGNVASFQRQPGTELACVGDVHGTPLPHTVRVHMEGEITSIRQKLEVLQMDHSMPKHTRFARSGRRVWRGGGVSTDTRLVMISRSIRQCASTT